MVVGGGTGEVSGVCVDGGGAGTTVTVGLLFGRGDGHGLRGRGFVRRSGIDRVGLLVAEGQGQQHGHQHRRAGADQAQDQRRALVPGQPARFVGVAIVVRVGSSNSGCLPGVLAGHVGPGVGHRVGGVVGVFRPGRTTASASADTAWVISVAAANQFGRRFHDGAAAVGVPADARCSTEHRRADGSAERGLRRGVDRDLKRSDRRAPSSGMLAPPPTVATAARSAFGIPLRCNASSTVPRNRSSGPAMSCSNSVRDNRTSSPGAGRDPVAAVGCRQLFLGAPAFDRAGASASRFARCRQGRWPRFSGHGWRGHVIEDELIDRVAGEIGVSAPTGRSARKFDPAFDQSDAGAAGAEITQRNDAVGRESRLGAQRRRAPPWRRRPTPAAHRSRARSGWAKNSSRSAVELGLGPVRGDRDGDRCPVADGACHGFDRFNRQYLAEVLRPVGRHQRSPVADPLDESPQHQSGFGQIRVFCWQTNFGWPVLEQRQHGTAGHRSATHRAATRLATPIDSPSDSLISRTPVSLVSLAVAGWSSP